MSRRIELPSHETAHQALKALVEEAKTNGTSPTVVELARTLGLTNTTFWRHFPDLANEIRVAARQPDEDAPSSPARQRFADLERRSAELGRENRQLAEHLDLAVANIQRLTLDNHQLRQALESANKVTKLTTRTRS